MENSNLPYEQDGIKQDYVIDWNKVKVVQHFSKKVGMNDIMERLSGDIEPLLILKAALTYELKMELFESSYTVSQFDKIVINFGPADRLISKFVRGVEKVGGGAFTLEGLGIIPVLKQLVVLVSDRWFDLRKEVMLSDYAGMADLDLRHLATVVENTMAGDMLRVYSEGEEHEEFEAFSKRFDQLCQKAATGAEADPGSTSNAYRKQLEAMKEAGITPGLGIGPEVEGGELAVKYILRGAGEHEADEDDRASYPGLNKVEVKLSWGPEPEQAKPSWMVDVVFKADDGREEMIGMNVSMSDHEITISRKDFELLNLTRGKDEVLH